MVRSRTGAMQIALVFVALLIMGFAASCSTTARQLFFDIPPPAAEKPEDLSLQAIDADASTGQQADPKALLAAAADDGSPRPAIEDVQSWEEALEILPKDYKGKADWTAALEQGVVRPRGGDDPLSVYAAIFKYDFIMEAEKPKNEAYFPHSAHTEWLGCKNCHTSIYPYKRNPATMKEIKKGESCGTCHGKENVAFSLKACKRCHLNR